MSDKKSDKLELRKPNELIEVEGRELTHLKIKSYNYILHRFQQEQSNMMIISGADIFNAIGLSKNYEEVTEYLDSLHQVRVVSRDARGRTWGGFYLLSAFKKLKGGSENGLFYIEIPQLIFKALCKNEKLYYTTINLLEQHLFKCTYSLVFHEFFKKYEGCNLPVRTIDDLKAITGTAEKYTEFKYFKRDVLDKAIEEINQYDENYIYSYEPIKFGRKISEIKFMRKNKKKKAEKITVKIEAPELEKAIEKARKNRFINDKYNALDINKLLDKYAEKYVIKALYEAYSYNKEITSFYKFVEAKIKAIKETEEGTKTKTSGGITSTKDSSNILESISSPPQAPEEEKEKQKVTQAEYEQIKKDYLKKAQVTGDKIPKHIEIALERNMNKYEIIEEAPEKKRKKHPATKFIDDKLEKLPEEAKEAVKSARAEIKEELKKLDYDSLEALMEAQLEMLAEMMQMMKDRKKK